MARAATPGDPGLPCSPEQALALYQRLFRCPVGLGQLRAALWQVREGRACPQGLELPAVLLEMERSRRAQEQLLWDLELLTGAGLGLFWPPRVQVSGLRDWAQHEWSQHSEPCGGMGADPRRRTREVHPRRPLHSSRGRDAAGGSSAPGPGAAGSDAAPRWESPGMPAEPTPGCLQELDPTPCSSFGKPGNSAFKNWVLKEERGQAKPTTHRPLALASGSPQGRTIPQEATGPSGLPEPQDSTEGLGWSLSQDRTELQKLLGIESPQSQREETPQGQGEEAPQGQGEEAPQGQGEEAPQGQGEEAPQGQGEEAPRGQGEEAPQGQGEEAPQGQGEETPQGENEEAPQTQTGRANQARSGESAQALGQEVSGGLGWETPQGEDKDALQDPKENCPECPRKETPQSQEVKDLPFSGGRGWVSQAWEVAQGEAPAQPREEGKSWGSPGDFCESLGEQISQSGRREGPGPGGRGVQLTPDKALAMGEQWAGRGKALAPLQLQRPPAQPQLPSPGAVMQLALSTRDSEQQERPTALPGLSGLLRNPYGLQDSGAGPGPGEQQADETRGLGADGSVRFPGPLEGQRGAAEGPKASKAAWPGRPGKEKASGGLSAAQRQSTLQRLLELQGAARRRRWQDREQQRLRILDRLHIARNRLCRVHPLGPPPSPAQLQSQDMEGQRSALREQLEQVHRERTGRLQALGARNTQNFQQLLCPTGAEEHVPGE